MSLFDMLNGLSDADDDKRKSVRAAFRMSGAKTRLLPELMPVLESYSQARWVDHCGGTGVVSWNKRPCKQMIYNDRYSAVADFYLSLRNDRVRLKEALLEFHPRCRQLWEFAHAEWNKERDPVRRSALWYYMAVNSVAGKRGHFGRAIDTPQNFIRMGLEAWDELEPVLRRFEIENLDVIDSLKTYDSPNTLHYIDPPYLDTDQETFETKWDRASMHKLLVQAHACEGTVAISHTPHPMLDAEEWTDVHEWSIRSSVGGAWKVQKENLYVRE